MSEKVASFLRGMAEMISHDVKVVGISLLAFAIAGTLLSLLLSRRADAGQKSGWAFPRELYRHKQARVDFVVFFVNTFFWIPILFQLGAVILGGYAFSELLSGWLGVAQPIVANGWVVLAVQVVATLLAAEFTGYWLHRLMHKVPFLWPIHAVHHTTEVLTPFSKERNHPFEYILFLFANAVISGPVTGLAIYATGGAFHPLFGITMVALAIAQNFQILFNHSHFALSLGPFDRIFQSPAMHRIHHSAETYHRDRNFGASLSIFDRMFGTNYRPAPGEKFRLGLDADHLGEANPHNSVRSLYLEPVVTMAAMLRRKPGNSVPDPVDTLNKVP